MALTEEVEPLALRAEDGDDRLVVQVVRIGHRRDVYRR